MSDYPERFQHSTLWLLGALIFGLVSLGLGTIASQFVFLNDPFVPALAGLAGTIVIFGAAFYPKSVFLGFITLCMVVPHELEELYVPLGFMKLYIHDVVFGFMLLYVLWLRFIRGASFHGLKFNHLLNLYLLVGVSAAAIGLARGNAYDYVLGDFRRSFFYFSAYYITLICITCAKDIHTFYRCLFIGSLLAIAKGFLQIIAGDFVMRRFGDAAHILNHFEVTFSSLAVYIALYRLVTGVSNKLLWGAVAAAGTSIILMANYRTCWIGFLAGIVLLFIMISAKQRAKVIVAGLAVTLLLALTLSFAWHVPVGDNHATIGENINAKMNLADTATDPNIGWRLDSYRNALNLWLETPVWGQGLGKNLEFITATSTGGSMMAMGHRVHNSYLWLLMSLGAVGFLVFAFLHAKFFFRCLKAIKREQADGKLQSILVPCVCLYLTIMVSACFDVYLESSPPITILSVIMAVSLLLLEYQKKFTAVYLEAGD